MNLLDVVAQAKGEREVSEALEKVIREFVDQREDERLFDWRYYMVKYPSMRERGSSTSFAELFDGEEQASMGYSLCMLGAAREL